MVEVKHIWIYCLVIVRFEPSSARTMIMVRTRFKLHRKLKSIWMMMLMMHCSMVSAAAVTPPRAAAAGWSRRA